MVGETVISADKKTIDPKFARRMKAIEMWLFVENVGGGCETAHLLVFKIKTPR